ncbi:MAG TPA: NYN domain-containing protein [Candidatus Acidoferrales bacterium]|nr:NYN domain-containing protein [Candidatus Acidoferrales bacterium]
MAKIAFLIDGFNLCHALDYTDSSPDHFKYGKYKWLNLSKLASLYVARLDSLSQVILFTAIATWDPAKAARHKLFIRANQSVGVTVVYGEFKRKERKCRVCRARYFAFEEKQTDVNIALGLFELAVKDVYDRAILVSGDTDLIPAIKAVQRTFPHKQIGTIVPIGKASESILRTGDFSFKMRERHLASCRFPDKFELPDRSTLICPPTWK